MSLRWRLALLMALLVTLPAVSALWVTRQLVTRSLDLGLSPELTEALDAGVRRARTDYQLQRELFAARVDGALGALSSIDPLDARLAGAVPGSTLVVVDPTGTPRVVRGTATAPGMPDARPPEPGAPPTWIEVTRAAPPSFPSGTRLVVGTPTDPTWRDDAAAVGHALQIMRGLQLERRELEGRFWIPFLVIYVLSLATALGIAIWWGRRITRPLDDLVRATDAVAAGDWRVRVPASASGEMGVLGTRFNRMVETLDAQSRRLVDLEKMAGWREMARALAHEVKNPLTPIQLTVEEMRERYPGDDPKYASLLAECSGIVVKEVESLRTVVSRFREFSRPVDPITEPVDLNALVAEVVALQRDLVTETELGTDVGEVPLDPDRMRQVLMNLARNAQAAAADADPPRLRVITRRTGATVLIRVEDNGPGIPEDERERIFEPYHSKSKDGLGLGLTLVKGIILAHGGRIEVDRSGWGGAAFLLTLPATEATT